MLFGHSEGDSAKQQADDKTAAAMLRALWNAEKAYAASDPQHAYTCDGANLPGFQSENWSSDGMTLHNNRLFQYNVNFVLCAGGSRKKFF